MPHKIMIKKELSITELFGILSVVALSISVISNAFFYYSLDALWVMSVLSPTFYILDIVKVIVIIFFTIAVVGGLMDLYTFLLKKIQILKPKAKYKLPIGIDESGIKKQLKKTEQKFIRWQSVFVILISTSCLVLLLVYSFISSATLIWSCGLIGIILAIFTDEGIRKDKELKYMVFIILAVFTTCFSAQLKLNSISSYPEAFLKSHDKNKWYVLDSFQDKVILLNKTENKSNIKVVKFEEIDRISATN